VVSKDLSVNPVNRRTSSSHKSTVHPSESPITSEKRQKYVRHWLLSVVLSYNMVVFHHESFRQPRSLSLLNSRG
jgi:hypothetical protein